MDDLEAEEEEFNTIAVEEYMEDQLQIKHSCALCIQVRQSP